MAYQMVATAVTTNDLEMFDGLYLKTSASVEGHSTLADVFKSSPSNICAFSILHDFN